MRCEVEYCIYNQAFACMLDEIQIDGVGLCDSCEMIAVPKELMEQYKKERLKEMQEQ